VDINASKIVILKIYAKIRSHQIIGGCGFRTNITKNYLKDVMLCVNIPVNYYRDTNKCNTIKTVKLFLYAGKYVREMPLLKILGWKKEA